MYIKYFFFLFHCNNFLKQVFAVNTEEEKNRFINLTEGMKTVHY